MGWGELKDENFSFVVVGSCISCLAIIQYETIASEHYHQNHTKRQVPSFLKVQNALNFFSEWKVSCFSLEAYYPNISYIVKYWKSQGTFLIALFILSDLEVHEIIAKKHWSVCKSDFLACSLVFSYHSHRLLLDPPVSY